GQANGVLLIRAEFFFLYLVLFTVVFVAYTLPGVLLQLELFAAACQLYPDVAVVAYVIDCCELAVIVAPHCACIVLDEHDLRTNLELQGALCRQGTVAELAFYLSVEGVGLAGQGGEALAVNAVGLGIV